MKEETPLSLWWRNACGKRQCDSEEEHGLWNEGELSSNLSMVLKLDADFQQDDLTSP
jgi:hypothetical protein